MDSPFLYGTDVSGKYFINREEEKQTISDLLLSGKNLMLIAPRRIGKTSLVKESLKIVRKGKSDLKICFLNLFSITSEKEFYEELIKVVVQEMSSSWEEWVSLINKYLPMLELKMNIDDYLSNKFSVELSQEKMDQYYSEILDFAERVSEDKGKNILICIDEFQKVKEFDTFDALEKRIRTGWYKHKNVNYCIFGCNRSFFKELFYKRSVKPNHKFDSIIELEKINSDEWANYIQTRFKSTGKFISKYMALKIAQLMDNHSWYVQQLSHYAWLNTDRELFDDDLKTALEQVINTNSPFFIREYGSYCNTQRNLLKAILSGETKLTSRRVMDSYAIGTNRNISRHKTFFEVEEVIEPTEKGYKMVDPVYALWFRQNILHEDLQIL